jgi:hypothetical protein
MPRQQMSQFWSEDFVAHDLQILSIGKSEDKSSDFLWGCARIFLSSRYVEIGKSRVR